jgi:hypothetical protein
LVVFRHPSEKYDFVSWDDGIPNWMESHKIPWFQTTNQNTKSCSNSGWFGVPFI